MSPPLYAMKNLKLFTPASTSVFISLATCIGIPFCSILVPECTKHYTISCQSWAYVTVR